MKKYKTTMTASEIVKALEDDPRFKRENQGGAAQISEEEINKFEQMSVDEQLQLTGEDKIALTEYYKYKQQNRQQQIKSNEIELHSFYEEVRATGLDTDYYRGIEDSQLNKSIIKIILKHLDKDYSRDALQILIDKLQSSKARGMAGAKLIDLYKKADNSLRFYIAQTLEKVATKNELNDILSIFNNPKISDEGKDYLPLVIAKIMGKQAIPILIQVVEEKTSLEQSNLLVIMCIEALGKLHAVEAKELIEPYTKHQDNWYQNQAKKALRKINTTKLPTGIKFIKDNKIKYRGAKRPADPVGWQRAGNEQKTVLPKAKKSSVNAVARQSEGRAFDSTPSCEAGFHTQYERREARLLYTEMLTLKL